MDAEHNADVGASRIALAIGEPARARMLYCLLDDRALTSTELATVADVTPSTASVHLNRLRAEGLVTVLSQGKHRYYRLAGKQVASVLEGLSVLAGGGVEKFVPNTPNQLRSARTCYDHIAGALGVSLHDRFNALSYLSTGRNGSEISYELTPGGLAVFESLGVDVVGSRKARRQFAFGCLDWSERRYHIAGALGAAILTFALKRNWIVQEIDSRALQVTRHGEREMFRRFGVRME